jgi:holo-[acyl-carrier protein] synthase
MLWKDAGDLVRHVTENHSCAGNPRYNADQLGGRMIETGVDIVEIDRVEALVRKYGDRFRARVFTDREWVDCAGRAESLAARFDAKEATIKALGSRAPALHDIEVVRPGDSRPRLRLRGRAAELARHLGVRELALSITHGREHAVAIVVLSRDGEAAADWDWSTDPAAC